MDNSLTNHSLKLENRVVIITGGGKGVGKGICMQFLEAGAQVVICSRNKPTKLPLSGCNEAFYIPVDVRKIDDIQACVNTVVKKFGRIDILINNAGGSPLSNLSSSSPRFSEAIIHLNLIGPIHFCQVVNTVMQSQKQGGSIINISSISATRPSPGTAVYGAAKAGLINLSTSLAVEWGPKVRINSIIAGLIETDQTHLHYGGEPTLKAISNTIPLKRLAIPKDIGNACLFLSSPLASYISGSTLTVHGGGEKPLYQEIVNNAKNINR